MRTPPFIGYFVSVHGHLYETNRASRLLAARIAYYLERGALPAG